ncbi:unnamed protein product [Microthlaspi erraticum]|uniref:RNase H type-1 domain-containing protein n=1 Tax=Microthlaspi erraticum TaxID=1685480 RepID=A0A6D2LDB7_9BRAS|nr:unnamed protein product [Microthlaspi erraticum]
MGASSDTSGRRRAAFGEYGELRFSGDRCQVDGAWKETDPRAGLGWYNFNMETGEVLLGTCNLWRGVSSLPTEVEALLWAMQCMLRHNKLVMVFETDCSDVVQMVSKPEEWPVFAHRTGKESYGIWSAQRIVMIARSHLPETAYKFLQGGFKAENRNGDNDKEMR